jgi:hypothetical protein
VKILGPWSLGLDDVAAGVGSSVSWQYGLKWLLIFPQVKKELSIAEEGVGALPIEEEEGGAADLGTMPPLYSYSPSSGGFSGYSN